MMIKTIIFNDNSIEKNCEELEELLNNGNEIKDKIQLKENTVLVLQSVEKKKSNKKSKEDVRHRYGEYKHVMLKDCEIEKLKQNVPNYENWIKKVDEYCEQNGKSYTNYYLTILNWYNKEKGKKVSVARDYRGLFNDIEF